MKKALVALALIVMAGFAGIFLAFRYGPPSAAPDIVTINDIVMTAMRDQDQEKAANMMAVQIAQYFEEADSVRQSRDAGVQIALYIIMGLFALAFTLLLCYINRSILTPFRRLKRFAQNVAAGNLDIPLEMDRKDSFGAFTESFDLMRTELARARAAERQANQSKKELVASLSHDIKTPLASIKAVSELIQVTAQDERQYARMAVINAKADQISLLVGNLFNATLEELQELKVTPVEIPSRILEKLLEDADYDHKITLGEIPECMLVADPMRLAQVFDNILSNSYKYAGTPIRVDMELAGDILQIDVSDLGRGVAQKDLPLLTQKFFRGENAKGQNGTGLGLYISKYFMEKMMGGLRCRNRKDGFSVRLTLRLA